jgi:yeast amino acid transporter
VSSIQSSVSPDPEVNMAHENNAFGEKHIVDDVPVEPRKGSFSEHARGRQFSVDPEDRAMLAADQNALHRNLKGRHMQMIAMLVNLP